MYGPSIGTASTQFRRTGSGRGGKQTQAWLKIGDAWRIVQAHVSLEAESQVRGAVIA
ncbi:MAG: hypothetical protein JWN61_3177 [Pseudonocardiales bacterium]|nr:hypothetical protein [Pseudonocardiales bacterium]